jgi:hypothetical protein
MCASRLGLLAFAGAVAAVSACSAPGPVVVTGSGVVLYWHSQLVTLGACGQSKLMGALTPDAQRVEIVSYDSVANKLTSSVLSPPSGCEPFPVQIAPVDLDGDGILDLVISDSGCGTWYATIGQTCDIGTHLSGTLLPPTEAAPWMGTLGAGAINGFWMGNYTQVSVFARPNVQAPWVVASNVMPLMTTIGQSEVSSIATWIEDPSSGHDALFFQEGGSAVLLDVEENASDISLAAPKPMAQGSLETIRPFWALDQLTFVIDPICGQYAVGLGMFSQSDGMIPHTLQIVGFSGTGYVASQLDASDARVLAADVGTDGKEYVATISDDGAGTATLKVATIANCSMIGGQVSTSVSVPTGTTVSPNGMAFISNDGLRSMPDIVLYDGSRAVICQGGLDAGIDCEERVANGG